MELYIRGLDMNDGLSILSWNVESFERDRMAMRRIFKDIKEKEPSIFMIYELKDSMVYHDFFLEFHNYKFEVEKGPGSKEVLVGFNKDLDEFPHSLIKGVIDEKYSKSDKIENDIENNNDDIVGEETQSQEDNPEEGSREGPMEEHESSNVLSSIGSFINQKLHLRSHKNSI
jgi:hypothetical protein